MASKSTWVFLDEAEEIFGGPIPDDADIVSHVCNSDGLTVFTRDSVERAAMAKTDRENHNALIAGHYHTVHGLGVRVDYVGAARAVAGNGGGEDGSVSTPPAKPAGFHGRIMNLCPDFTEAKHHDIVYKRGYRDALHAAAEIGLEADAIAERLAKAERVIALQWKLPKPCGHDFDCICAGDAARAFLQTA